MKDKNLIFLQQQIGVINKTLSIKSILDFTQCLFYTKNNKKRIFIAGNGGSSSTASHFASDLMRLGFDVICLNDNISRLTALTNDEGWQHAYDLQLTHFQPQDILILISVHGGTNYSENLILAAKKALEKDGIILSLTGHDGGKLKNLSNVSIIVPSTSTPLIEGWHCLLTHIICELLKGEEKKNGTTPKKTEP